jgi:hypothetical protein
MRTHTQVVTGHTYTSIMRTRIYKYYEDTCISVESATHIACGYCIFTYCIAFLYYSVISSCSNTSNSSVQSLHAKYDEEEAYRIRYRGERGNLPGAIIVHAPWHTIALNKLPASLSPAALRLLLVRHSSLSPTPHRVTPPPYPSCSVSH